MLEKIIRDFMTIWTTVDPISNLALFAGPNCCHASQRTSKDRLARISLRRQMHGILALFLFRRQ
jgi:hypothetical protein